MSFYLYLNIAIIAFPLIFSFHPKIKFYKKIKPVLFAFLIIGILFVAWDSFATSRGHWSFNPEYVNEMRILGIPIEEILFFITVPYSCLFVFESINHFLSDKKLFSAKKWVFSFIGVLIMLSAFVFNSKEYSFLAVLSVGLTILFVSLLNVKLLSSRAYWIYIALTLALFLIFNYILTSIPVVEYSTKAITGIRVTTIPIEDFLFNYSMLTNYLVIYIWASKKLKLAQTILSNVLIVWKLTRQ
jgi:lycopene cyclase domain-containing protein